MKPVRWDIFCRVIDNFGDIGVSWRLARQLANEHGVSVRLWVDHLPSLHALCPEIELHAVQQVLHGVSVFQLTGATQFPPPGDVVIEAFGCGLPPSYVACMASSATPPQWIILEYLSAEPWVREHHGLPSPHPQLNLPRHFFFPGVAQGTGGVLREADLLARRDAFDAHAQQTRRTQQTVWARCGFDDVPHESITISLFAYPQAPYLALLAACARGTVPVVVAVPAGPLASRLRDEYHIGAGNRHVSAQLELRWVPFVPQVDYDELLWACDINFVRGEDSFVRAQWAGRPFVWQIYPQDANTHRVKLDAFLALYVAGLPPSAAQAVRQLWYAWNGVAGAPPVALAWQAFVAARVAQTEGLRRWQQHLIGIGDLAGNLLRFCAMSDAEK